MRRQHATISVFREGDAGGEDRHYGGYTYEGVEGLAIVPTLAGVTRENGERVDGASITHIPTGRKVLVAPSTVAAEKVLYDVAALADWPNVRHGDRMPEVGITIRALENNAWQGVESDDS